MTSISMRRFEGPGSDWNAMVASMPAPHILQTWEWSRVKAAHGWEPLTLVWRKEPPESAPGDRNGKRSDAPPAAAALVLKKQLVSRRWGWPSCVLYAPKGPLMNWGSEDLRQVVLGDLQGVAKREGAVFVKIDPDVETGRGIPGEEGGTDITDPPDLRVDLQRRLWRFSSDQIQFRNTLLLDLTLSEEDILGRMKQKTRYNIRLAEKKGVIVSLIKSPNFAELYRLYAETATRDGFVIRDEAYYHTVWETFLQARGSGTQPSGDLLAAYVNGEIVAAILVFYFAQRAYYMYGMSRAMHREKMPSHALQWAAIKRARARGCVIYDLWGAPDVLSESDPMWGVFRFKQGLGGDVVRTVGAWDYAPSPFWYALYTKIVPRLLDVTRALGRRRTKRLVDGASRMA